MDWDNIKVFLAVARAGSLGAAARALGQTQPTIGRRLRAFEAQLGQSLFQRSAEGFVLTHEGEAVLAHAQRMEDEALGFERRLQGQAVQLEGLLRVSSSDWFGVHVLAPVFARFQESHPKVCIELVTDARLFSLARREADLVFRIRRFEDAEVVQRRLMRMDYAVYGASHLPRPEAGAGGGAFLITMDSAFEAMPDVQWLRRMLPRAQIGLRSNNREVQAAFCASGGGWAVLPCVLGDRVPGVVRLDLGASPPSREVWVGFHRDLKRLSRLRSLLDFTVEALAD
ncbi:LysR family transcriptional regulator [Variovorax sp. JS1663]|nr:LysR family transcriptional regulator [Variovorax sp. JS1663]